MNAPRERPWIGALAFDAAAVLVFAAAGRNAHDSGSGLAAILGIAAPFLIGLALGWLLVPGARRRPLRWRTGAGVWATTVVVGMLLRRLAWDRGTALSFIIVTAVVLGLLMMGWRALWSLGTRRREIRSASPPSKAGR